MPVEVTLRTDQSFSPFRWRLKRLLTAPFGDSALICSGYIWEPDGGNWRVLDELEPDLIAGCRAGKVITVAGKLENRDYEMFYRNFIRRLRLAGLTVDAWIAPRRNWHAKIAMRLNGATPQAAIVGSSNLTRPAIGEGWHRWNFEGDVMIWPNGVDTSNHLTVPAESRGESISMRLTLDPTVHQPTEAEQLVRLYKDVMGSELERFEIR